MWSLIALVCLAANILLPTHSLKCQECSLTSSNMDGILTDDMVEEVACVERNCTEGVTHCHSGYSHIRYTGQVDGVEFMSGSVQVDVQSLYFKGCQEFDHMGCDMMELVAAMTSASPEMRMDVVSCEMKYCDTDNCNDIEPEVINPSGTFDPIQCYSCEKATIAGISVPLDENNPTPQECNSTNIVTCPIGVTSCASGNSVLTVSGVPMNVEYLKGCGGTVESSCSHMSMYMTAAGGGVDTCSSHLCDGALCNNLTAAQTAALVGSGSGVVASVAAVLLALLIALLA